MSEQQRQLDIMAMGGFDIVKSTKNKTGRGNGINPESLLLVKEQVEQDMINPCIGCIMEHTSNPIGLDHCHYYCKK